MFHRQISEDHVLNKRGTSHIQTNNFGSIILVIRLRYVFSDPKKKHDGGLMEARGSGQQASEKGFLNNESLFEGISGRGFSIDLSRDW